MSWFVRRVLMAVVVVWGCITLLFAIFFVLPGDRVDRIMGGDRVLSEQTRAEVRTNLGLDQPLTVQYGRYLDRLVHGDLGESYVTGSEVSSVLDRTVVPSLRLAFWAVAVEVLLGVGTGVLVATKRSKVLHGASLLGSVVLLSVPVFVVGFVLQLVFGVYPAQHGWPDWMRLQVAGIGPDTWVLGVVPVGDQWRYLVLPAVSLGIVSGAVAHRLTREKMRETMSSSYVVAARARGVGERRLIWSHGVRNAAPAIITFLAVDLATIFGSAIVTELVFNWPGVGSEMASALARSDAPVILGITIVLAVVYSVVNLAVDVVVRRLDPRVAASK